MTTPVLRVVRGAPTAEELAAVVAVLSSRGSAAAVEEPPVTSRWSDRAALVRAPLPHGPGAWQAAGHAR